ncbi:MAG: sirohydrochlorin chelatase [Nitrospirales bacterium]
MSGQTQRGVVLVGHGGIPKDFPRDRLARLKTLESQRRASRQPPTHEEIELEVSLRRWPRSSQTDPYQAGLEALAARLTPHLGDTLFALAYNEFCAPTVKDAVERLIAAGARDLTVVPSMLTPGGSHSELEIPAELEELRELHPGVTIRYAWPFDLGIVAAMLAAQVHRFQASLEDSRP